MPKPIYFAWYDVEFIDSVIAYTSHKKIEKLRLEELREDKEMEFSNCRWSTC